MENYSFSLIGHPIGHTMSPPIHNMLFEINNIHASYTIYDVEPECVTQIFDNLKKESGFNITIPHKQAIIPLVDRLDEKAELYHSVNTVKCGKENIGYNTDWIGFTKSLESKNIGLSGKVLLCGCGGVARTMATEAILSGAELTIAVRKQSLERAEKLKKELLEIKKDAVIVVSEDKNVKEDFDLLLNGTPCGMYPKTDSAPLDKKQISRCKNVFDSIYNPKNTLLLSLAEANGATCVGGMSMLVRQAAAAQEIWLDVSFPEKKLLEITEKANIIMEETFR